MAGKSDPSLNYCGCKRIHMDPVKEREWEKVGSLWYLTHHYSAMWATPFFFSETFWTVTAKFNYDKSTVQGKCPMGTNHQFRKDSK